MKEDVYFSIVIPLYNKSISISSTIESVLNQTYKKFEVIIIDDGSTDNSLKVAQSYEDSRIRIISKANGGVSSARNMGINRSRFKYIVFLDADDLWYPNCLEEFRKLICEFPDAKVYCTNYNMTGKSLKGSDRRYYVYDFYSGSNYFFAKWRISFMLTGCVTAKAECFDLVGLFQEGVTNGEDIDMWIRLAEKYIIAKSEVITTIYRQDAENRNNDLPAGERKLPKSHIDGSSVKNKMQRIYHGYLYLAKVLQGKKRFLCIFLKYMKFWSWIFMAVIFDIKMRKFARCKEYKNIES